MAQQVQDEELVCRRFYSDNTMIFCGVCGLTVHLDCFGVDKIPEGPWLCDLCTAGVATPFCMACPSKGRAMKPVEGDRTKWIHVMCALFLPVAPSAIPNA